MRSAKSVRSTQGEVRPKCGVRSGFEVRTEVRCPQSGVRSAECGVRSAECGVRSAKCEVRSPKSHPSRETAYSQAAPRAGGIPAKPASREAAYCDPAPKAARPSSARELALFGGVIRESYEKRMMPAALRRRAAAMCASVAVLERR